MPPPPARGLTCIKVRRAGFADDAGMPSATLASPSGFAHPAPALSVFLPKEHGSWAFVLEPLALGLLIAPSPAGAALGVAAVAGFFLRRPLKAALGPVPGRSQREAREAAGLLAVLAGTGLAQAVALAGLAPLWPLLLAVPLGALFARLDLRRDSRSLVAELAGTTAFGLLPAALATLAGWAALPALALAAFMLARSVPTVLTVRALVRRRKGETAGSAGPLTAAIAAFIAIAGLGTAGLLPFATVLLAGLLLLRTTVALLFPLPLSPRQIGIAESALGVALIAAAAAAYHLA